MKRNRMSISFVGVFTTPLSNIPAFDPITSANLLNIPQNNVLAGFTPDGFVIRNSINPFPIACINPQKVICAAVNEDQLFNLVQKVYTRLFEMGVTSNFSAYGINFEYEWTDVECLNQLWLSKRFLNKSITSANPGMQCQGLSFTLPLNDHEAISTNVTLRVGNDRGIFASINHHNAYPYQGMKSPEELQKLFLHSTQLLESNLFKIIES